MSIRRRLLLVVALAAVALGAAALAILHVLAATEGARMSASARALTATVETLAARIGSARDRSVLEEACRAAVAPMTDGRTGVCGDDGVMRAEASTGPHGQIDVRAKPLPPDQREAVVAACRAAFAGGESAVARVDHPHDAVLIATRRLSGGDAVWALARVPKTASDDDASAPRWKLDVALLAAMTLGLVAVTVSAMTALGRGVRGLESALGALQTDLRTTLREGPTIEFTRLTNGLTQMATNLADAHDRERELVQSLAHRDRLAALGRVAAGIAHEIRNPLAGVKLKLDVLERSRDVAPSVREDVRACQGEIARLDRVVRSLLSVARKSKRDDGRVPIAPLLLERAAMARAVGEGRSIRVETDLPRSAATEEEMTVRGDRDDIARALDNVLRNAVEASADGGTVTAKLTKTDEAIEIVILDRGAGVAEERRGELFEPFFTNKPEGTGLGLWLSKAIVEAHGGEISYDRSEGTTSFRLMFPREENP